MGLPENIPLVIGSLDHYMAATGAGLGVYGELSESTGTVLAAIGNIGKFAIRPKCCALPGPELDEFNHLAFDTNGAGVLEWYQRNFANNLTIQQLDKLASGIKPGCDGLMAKPNADTYPGLNGFLNVTEKHTHGHFARAIAESVASTLLCLISRMAGRRPKRILSTGGGANSDIWLEIKANVIDAEFVRVATSEPACCGAAMTAAVALGWFDNLHQTSQAWLKTEKTFSPTPQSRNIYGAWHAQYQKLAVNT